jgi:hypothetical protein
MENNKGQFLTTHAFIVLWGRGWVGWYFAAIKFWIRVHYINYHSHNIMNPRFNILWRGSQYCSDILNPGSKYAKYWTWIQYFATSRILWLHRSFEAQVALNVIKIILGYFLKTIYWFNLVTYVQLKDIRKVTRNISIICRSATCNWSLNRASETPGGTGRVKLALSEECM